MLEAAIFCLALNVYHEARGEPIKGQQMVAYVTMNRAGWVPSRVCPTVFKPYQFSWTIGAVRKIRGGWGIDRSLKPHGPSWILAQNIARTVIEVGVAPIGKGQVWFYHRRDVHPRWARSETKVAVIGSHVFYR